VARTRTGEQLIDDSYLRADLVGATDRHPRTTVLRYINQGCTELYDLLVAARGRAYYRATPTTITTTASTSRYALPAAFYRLISLRVSGAAGFCLEPFTPQDEPMLREPGATAEKPTHYELQPGYVEMLPLHRAGVSVICDYVPVFTDLTDSSGSTFDGINGWEQYPVYFAAREMLMKDGETAEANAQTQAMGMLAQRIGGLAPKRDAFRAERVKNVRGSFPGGGWR
jgi:hypothetical protein